MNFFKAHEKIYAAATSVVAAIFLTIFKIVVGITTGSLGILAEAAHSALDLLAALVTLLAVRLAEKPADAEHTYGHGKIENLSALFETLLLFVTCGWIIRESIERLFITHTHVKATVWAFLVMVVSIALDYSRSRMLYKTAEKYNSQALEADALHFHTDIWSSSVVILGLACVKLGEFFPSLHFLHDADAVAAFGVAIIVIAVSTKLGIRAVKSLIDTAPHGIASEIKNKVEQIDGVIDCHNIRIRNSGADVFVDVHIHMNGNVSLSKAHSLTEEVEKAIQTIAPRADVTVHPEPHKNKRKMRRKNKNRKR
ncbi:MAG: cation diffusion facilitator family transporter [Spirochaetes bacterium]|nr:cation diffusion facilitator family transporter [Spirochaetota bacterium]